MCLYSQRLAVGILFESGMFFARSIVQCTMTAWATIYESEISIRCRNYEIIYNLIFKCYCNG